MISLEIQVFLMNLGIFKVNITETKKLLTIHFRIYNDDAKEDSQPENISVYSNYLK